MHLHSGCEREKLKVQKTLIIWYFSFIFEQLIKNRQQKYFRYIEMNCHFAH